MIETRSFEPVPESVAAARRFARGALHGAPAETLEAVELMVSELASNCIRHTGHGFALTVSQNADEIRVEASDSGTGDPRKRSPDVTDATGRGLLIIDMLAAAWGVNPRASSGKTVWFTLRTAPAPEPRSAAQADRRDAPPARGMFRMARCQFACA